MARTKEEMLMNKPEIVRSPGTLFKPRYTNGR
jgi:hypothetical protein